MPKGPEDKTLYSQCGVIPIDSIINVKKRKACSDIFPAFVGPPKKLDPAHVKLRETGWTMAQRVFHPKEAWPTKAFMNKHLTVVPKQRKEL